MYLMYYLDSEGRRVYTLKQMSDQGTPTQSAHPARFSPDGTYSSERVMIKARFGLLPIQTGKLAC